MHVRLENKESHKAQEIGDLIRAYNRSKREEAESEPLNLYVEDEKGNLMAGLVAETFGNWLEIEWLQGSLYLARLSLHRAKILLSKRFVT